MKPANNLASHSAGRDFNDRNLSQAGINYPQGRSASPRGGGERNLSQLNRQPGFAASRLAKGGQASISTVNNKRRPGLAQLGKAKPIDRQRPASDRAYFSELERLSANQGPRSDLEELKLSKQLLNKKTKAKELKLRDRLPSHRIHWDEERVKRLEVSSLEKKTKTKREQINLDDL